MPQSDYNREDRPKVARSKWIMRAYVFALPLCLVLFQTFCPRDAKLPAWAMFLALGGAICWYLGAMILALVWAQSVHDTAEKKLSALHSVPSSLPPSTELVFSYPFENYLQQTQQVPTVIVVFVMLIGLLISFFSVPYFSPLVLIGFIALLVDNFKRSQKTRRRLVAYQVPEAHELTFTPTGIRVGATWVIAGNPRSADELVPEGQFSFFIEWAQISQWTVLPIFSTGKGSGYPSRYQIILRQGERVFSIIRRPLIGHEVQILDYARSYMSCPVVLRDDIDHLMSKVAI